MDTDKKIRELEGMRENNWQRIIFVLRKHHDLWAQKNISPEFGPLKMSYMPVICNINLEGSAAVDIARDSMIIKQAMSRTIKELEEKGMITSTTDASDKRSERLNLTESGKKLVLDANLKVVELVKAYEKLVGRKNLDTAVSVINTIIKYHESLNDADKLDNT